MKLLPYQVQLGQYVLERVAAGDDGMGQVGEVRRLEEALKSFLERAPALDPDSKARAPDDAADLAEAATLMAVLALFLLSREEWDKAKPVFIRLLLVHEIGRAHV